MAAKLDELPELFQMVCRFRIAFGRAYARRDEPACKGGLYSGIGILHNHTFPRRQPQSFRRQKKHLRVWLGARDIIPVRYCVEPVFKPQPLQNLSLIHI